MLFTNRNLVFSDFTWKKKFAPENGGEERDGGGVGASACS